MVSTSGRINSNRINGNRINSNNICCLHNLRPICQASRLETIGCFPVFPRRWRQCRPIRSLLCAVHVLLGTCTCHPKSTVESVFGISLSDIERNAAKRYSIFPGPFLPIKKTHTDTVYWSKVNPELLAKLSKIFWGLGIVYRYAYGKKVIALCRGLSLLSLVSID